MGLHRTAHYLKTKGRNGDTELVHMTPDEVKGLQAIALRHGGSLTINPDTGLPEANFLKRALPTIAGIGVGVATGNPMLGSAVAGGLTMATGGSLMQGLMAGVGAYGGAGMMSGLAEAGATQIAAEAAPAALQQQAVTSGLPEVVSAAQTTPASINAAAEAMANLPPTSPIQSGTPLTQVADMYNKGQLTTEQYTNYANAHEAARQKAMESPFSSAFRGLGVGGPQGFSPTNLATNVYDVVKRDPTKLAMAAAPLLTDMETDKRGGPAGYQSDEYDERLKKYRLSPNYQAYEAPKPNPYYTAQYPTYAAEGGIMQSYQAGGPVERMSQMNTAMNPQGGLYPMGMIDKTQYATPTQRPVSAELVTDAPAYERSNPMLMASGGEVKGYADGGFVNPRGTMSPEMQAYYAQDFANQRERAERNEGLFGAQPLLPERSTPQVAATSIAQPTGQSTFPGAASMQGGFGQGAQGYPSFTMGSGGGGSGSGGPFPLEGQYGIVKMNTGGIASFAAGKYLPKGDPGIYRDPDPTTRALSALDAEEVQRKKLMKRFGVPMAEMPKTGIKSLGGDMSDMAAAGGTASLGGYSDGGRMLKGPGDGMSDSIPASIGNKQPARLADGEFVVPADVVSHLGNGSTDAGARKLYSMMDKIRKARTGKKKQAPAVKADRYMPA